MMRSILLLLCLNWQLGFAQYYPIEIKGKWGYMDMKGDLTIQPAYDLADDFNEGYAVVALQNMPCLIDLQNHRIIDTGLYQTIHPMSEGLCSVTDFKNHKFYLNTKGEKVIALGDSIYEARYFKNGVAVVAIQYDKHETKFEVDISTVAFRFGFMNKQGQFMTALQYDDADDMQNGMARFRKGTLFGIIDSTGKEIVPSKFSLLDIFSEQKAVINMNGKFGFINQAGEIIIKPNFEMAFDFSDGLAGISVKGKYGYINEKGAQVIKPTYEQIRAFSQGLAAVQKDGKWGFINHKGDVVIPFNYDNASVFSEGACAVLIKRKWGFINQEGRLIVPADFDAVGSFENGIADVVYRDLSLYVNKRGDVLPHLH